MSFSVTIPSRLPVLRGDFALRSLLGEQAEQARISRKSAALSVSCSHCLQLARSLRRKTFVIVSLKEGLGIVVH